MVKWLFNLSIFSSLKMGFITLLLPFYTSPRTRHVSCYCWKFFVCHAHAQCSSQFARTHFSSTAIFTWVCECVCGFCVFFNYACSYVCNVMRAHIHTHTHMHCTSTTYFRFSVGARVSLCFIKRNGNKMDTTRG